MVAKEIIFQNRPRAEWKEVRKNEGEIYTRGIFGIGSIKESGGASVDVRRSLSEQREKSCSPRLQVCLLPQVTLWQLRSPAKRVELKEEIEVRRLRKWRQLKGELGGL